MLFARPDIPLDQDASVRFMPWLIAFMVFLATLALASLLVVEGLVERWDRGLRAELTVYIPPPDGVAPPDVLQGLRQQRLDKVLNVLAATSGVLEAQALSQEAVGQLVEPWLGSNRAEVQAFLPNLLAVRIDPVQTLELPALQLALDEAVGGTQVDDHQRWLGALISLARSVELGALIVLGLVAMAGTATVIFVTRASLVIHRPVIELLHLMGAEDRYIAKQFQGHALRFSLRGGLLGFAAAVGVIAAFAYLGGQVESAAIPRIELGLLDWVIVASVLLATCLLAMVTARCTVMRTLGMLQ